MRVRSTFCLTLLVASIALLALSSVASAATESGSTNKWPWSGYWWPMLSTDLNLYDNGQAMQLYDQYLQNTTGTRGGAQNWESQNHGTSDAANSWWGHCHPGARRRS